MLLVRGQLLLRYPDAVIYAVKAASPTQLGNGQKQALFTGRLDPDITFAGFDLGEEEARGDDGGAGWFFVMQEQPTAPRFGLDETASQSLQSADDLAWDNLDVAPGGHLLLEQAPSSVSSLPGWAFNGAHMAAIFRQRPARVAIHGSIILPPKQEEE